MLCPTAWENLPETEKLTEFEKAKQLANIRQKTCVFWIFGNRIEESRDHIYRPLLPLLGSWASFKQILDSEYPDGEYSEFHNKAATLENYTTLYNWVENKCDKCGSAKIIWDQGDKSIVTYCTQCSNEKFFVKGSWY
jgi:hypothetical protein